MEIVKPFFERRWQVICAYLAMVMVITFPTVLDPFTAAIGHHQTTVGCHLWVLWWSAQGLPLETEMLFYPNGTDVLSLYGSDVLSFLPPFATSILRSAVLLRFGLSAMFEMVGFTVNHSVLILGISSARR